MLDEGQPGVPVLFVRFRVKTHRQCTQVGIERRHIELRAHRLQAGAEQHVRQLHTFVVDRRQVAGAQQEGNAGAIQLVAIPLVLFHLCHILAHTPGLGILTDGIFRQLVKIAFQRVLRLYHDGHADHRPLREHVHQRIDFLLTALHFPGDGPGLRRTAQLFDRNGAVRLVIKPPHAVVRIGHRRRKPQCFGKIVLYRHRAFRRIAAVEIGRLTVQRIFIHPFRVRIEVTQHPVMHLRTILPHTSHTGPVQCAGQPFTGLVQHGNRWHRVGIAFTNPAVHHHARAALLATPGLIGDQRVPEQPFRPCDPPQVPLGFLQPGVGQVRTPGMRLDIAAQATQVGINIVFILAEKLHHPGVLIMLIKRVLQGVFHRVTHLLQLVGGSPFRRHGSDFINRTDGYAVIKQYALLMIQKLRPGQIINDGWIGVVNLLLVLDGHLARAGQRFAAGHRERCAIFHDGHRFSLRRRHRFFARQALFIKQGKSHQ
ncbi:Uncharacterised protein [Klebsiella pneumoniae]|nr:Uncharacterised protein [Klebsiella pneumoniae]